LIRRISEFVIGVGWSLFASVNLQLIVYSAVPSKAALQGAQAACNERRHRYGAIVKSLEHPGLVRIAIGSKKKTPARRA
jgi:hypothetical protein